MKYISLRDHSLFANIGLCKYYLVNYFFYISSRFIKWLPRRIHFKYTYRCNLSCPMCGYKGPEYLSRKEIDIDVYDRWLELWNE